ncbi:flagellar basal body L-ring protein FlgH [Sphingomonas sp. KRR8]|uniref:flagellar basal body L-ring protein FlgH n=1 Tax=Sphingomonas sp. KRR8 TaxID=2942996 RepID=UPI002022747B|nr:flagellar basal body L-ring protein FlgH [Sphingomonas sp. KRR8]URD62417.1 flagellar basal body L-ring protein FlgH [Sphingomonas sp. KRR8]
MRRIGLLIACAALGGCGVAGTIASVGRPPRFSKPTEVPAPAIEPSLASSGRSDRAAPAPAPPPVAEQTAPLQTASLFRPGAAGLFRDNRAYAKGDILTIKVQTTDKAAMDNANTRNRTGSETAGIAGLLGLDKLIDKVLPGKNSSGSVTGSSKSGSQGSGTIARSETINLTLAAVVTDVLPNGNLMIRGRQEMRVDNELRELVITGLIRPQDITRDNSIKHTQIAEARVLYGGRGQLTSAQQARWGQQIYDALFPF